MYIIPAIDLIKGKCVRLIQGDYQRKIIYADDPAQQARLFIEAGAEWLHVIDLDGAKIGRPVNTKSIARIAALKKLSIEVGGGIRQQDHIEQLLALGVKRIIIGTRAVSDFKWFSEMAEKFPDKLVLGLDARGSKVATHGWTQQNSHSLLDFAAQAAKLPLAAIIYTDITKDGMMAGPNFQRTKQLADATPTPLIAAGGVNSINDIIKLKELENIHAAIIGRALYEGSLTLNDAITAAAD